MQVITYNSSYNVIYTFKLITNYFIFIKCLNKRNFIILIILKEYFINIYKFTEN